MDIEKNTSIRDQYHQGYERADPPSEIVIHGTAGGRSARGLIRWMERGERGSQYRRGIGLFHYLIGHDGEIFEIIDPDRWVYHSSSGRHDERTIGIELMNMYRDNGGGYTEAQYRALSGLISSLQSRYDIELIRSHSRAYSLFTGGTKPGPPCPGSFDWSRARDMLVSFGASCTQGNEELTGIKWGGAV